MNKYNGLLMKISEEYSIERGNSEDINHWKIRLIYCLLGRMALASLFDMPEDEPVSVVHMKRRIRVVLKSYNKMYPELFRLLPDNSLELENEIYDIYFHTGVIYHKPNRVVMAAETEAIQKNIVFTRGYALEKRQKMSGLGTYLDCPDSSENTGSLSDMFQLEKISLKEYWKKCTDKVKWTELNTKTMVEYLRTVPPFTRGYWTDKPDANRINGKISILRIGFRGTQLYYLYKIDDGKCLVSQLPQWQTDGYNYRFLANACLASEGILPPTTYRFDGQLVYLNFGYLPPPAELYLWKLYTWPESFISLPCDFRRVCTRCVFETLKNTMIHQGYEFTKG